MNTKVAGLPIYMDHNATTPLDPHVLQVMEPYFHEQFGNAASSSHAYGWQAQTAVKRAREQVANLVGCEPANVLWTSGATESNNLSILGVILAELKAKGASSPHLITQATEHKAVLEVCDAAQEWGAEVTVIPVNNEGLVAVEDVSQALRPNTVLCSIMVANNEVGTLQPIAAIAELCSRHKIIFHCDAAQGLGKVIVDLRKLAVDLMSISGHKIYGPKGVGALILRPINREFTLQPLMFGGDQEKRLRPGTLNIPGIVGLGEACAMAKTSLAEETRRIKGFQQEILKTVLGRFPQVKLNGPKQNRLCNNLSFSFPEQNPDAMILALSGIAYSSGSACCSNNPLPSHVLKAMGLSDQMARATLRLGLGRYTTAAEVQVLIDKLLKMLDKMYSSSTQAGRSAL